MDSDDVYAFDSTVVHLAGTETITGNKTFSGSVSLGSSATATTPAASDNSTKVATTAWFNLADVKKMIVVLMMPDYASATGITFPDNTHEYTAPSNGYLMMSFYRNEDELIYGYINGVISPFAYNDMLNGQLNMQYSIPLSKGDKFYWNSSMSGVVVNSCYFVPCVGG